MPEPAAHDHPSRPVWAQRVASLGPTRTANVHDFMVLAFFVSGSAVVEQRERFEVQAGDFYLIPAGAKHRVIAARSPETWGVGFYPTCFGATELASLLEPFDRAARGASAVIPIAGQRQAHVAGLCAELHRETQGRGPSSHAAFVQRSLLGLLLAEVGRAGAGTSDTAAHPGFVGDVLRYLERHCLGPVTLADVARAVDRSPSHVSTVVRRATGKSVGAWILAGRLAEARNRLLHTDERVDVIAERVGYADPTHFIRLFRRAHGSTPAAWRIRERAPRQPAAHSSPSAASSAADAPAAKIERRGEGPGGV
jgi:AraC family transcriptional regulator, transcriptional activator of pobA